MREKPKAWASLYATSSGGGSSRAPSGCRNGDGGGDDGDTHLTSSSTRNKIPPDPSQRRTQFRDRSRSGSQTSPSSRLTPRSPVQLERHEPRAQRRDPCGKTQAGTVQGMPPQTAPCYLLCGSITDAETGEPLQLRRPRWEFPPPGRRARTAGPPGGVFGAESGPSCWGDFPVGELTRGRCGVCISSIGYNCSVSVPDTVILMFRVLRRSSSTSHRRVFICRRLAKQYVAQHDLLAYNALRSLDGRRPPVVRGGRGQQG